MLTQGNVSTTLPVVDLDRAKSWYQEKLGMTPAKEIEGGAIYEVAGSSILLFPTSIADRGGHTQVAFEVPDLRAEMAELRSRGVVFEEYDLPDYKTVDGVIEWPGGASAYCKDSEGNLICVNEFRG
ncbi:VOC family protein [Kitasatospora sp. NPDC001664]|uniref:VOC family protein n=1 Tax=Kitasatospora albolonga TaxID=68173 RepID=UPI0031F03F8A